MGTFTLGTPILLATGYQMTFNVAAGTCNGTITVDSSKISITCTDDSMDGGAATTVNRTLTITSASVSGATLTCDLSEYIFNDSTVVKVTLQAAAFTDVTPDTSDALAETSVDIATTPSTLDYPVPRMHWITPAHQRYSSGTVTQDAQGGCLYGIERVKGILRYRTAVVSTAAGITGTFVYNEAVSWTGGTGVFAPGSPAQTGAGSAKTIHIFVRTGVAPSAGLTITGGTSTATIVVEVAGVSGGTEYTSTQTARTLRTRQWGYGPSTQYEVWRFTWTGVSALGAYEREFTAYPHVGDTPLISTSPPSSNWFATGDNELYIDPSNTETFSTKYVDSRYSISLDATGIVGTIAGGTIKRYDTTAETETATPLEFIGFYNAGTLTAVKVSVQSQANGAGTLYYCDLPNQLAAYEMAVTGVTGGTPAYGDLIYVTGNIAAASNFKLGFVLKFVDGGGGTGTVTFIRLHTSNIFSGTDALTFRTMAGVATGVTATFSSIGAAITTAAAASGHTFEAYDGGATGLCDDAPATLGNDTTGTGAAGAPYRSITKAMNSIGTGATLVDGSTIRCFPGLYSMDNSATGTKSNTKHHWLHIEPHESYTQNDIWFVNSLDTSAGIRCNFSHWKGTAWCFKESSSGIFITTNSPETAGSPGTIDNRVSLWFEGPIIGLGRVAPCSLATWGFGSGNYAAVWVTGASSYYTTLSASHIIDSGVRELCNDVATGAYVTCNVSANVLGSLSFATVYHCDVHQSSAADPINKVNTNIMAKGLLTAAGYFGGTGTDGTYGGLYVENVLIGDDATADLNQYGASAVSTAVRWNDITFVQSTFADRTQWIADANAVLYGERAKYHGCVVYQMFRTQSAGAPAGIANVAKAASVSNCHIVDLVETATATTMRGADCTVSTSFADACVSTTESSTDWLRPKAASVLLDRIESTPATWPNYPKYDIDGRLLSDDATALAAIGARQPLPVLTVTYDGASVSDGGTVTEGSGSKDLVMSAATGPTGSVVYISDVAFGGTVTGTDASPYTLTSGGATQSATITTTLTSGAGTVDITYDYNAAIFDFDITGQSAGGGFRSRSRSRKR